MALLVDIATLLTGETNKYYGDMPDTPNNVCVLYNNGGLDSQHVLGDGVAVSNENPLLQILVRDTSYATAVTRCEAIKGQLDGKTSTTINGNNYISIFMVGDIESLNRDSKNRITLLMNFKIKVKRGG